MGSDSESDESREIVSSESQEADTTAGNSDEIRTGPSGVPHNVPPEVLSLLYSKETHEVKNYNPLYDLGTAEHLTMLINQDGKIHERETELRKDTLKYFETRDSKILGGVFGACIAVAASIIMSPEAANAVMGIVVAVTGMGVGAGNMVLKAKSKKKSEDEED